MGVNYCSKCNPVTKLCIKCEKDIFIPDENGGCTGANKCIGGTNHCIECNENENKCKTCETGYFPDSNGGCSYTDNCEISYQGNCLKCIDEYILIGASNLEIKICKSLNSEDLKNCEKINKEIGFCEKCIDDYYLGKGDKKCIKTENCYESSFGICKKCIKDYYYDKIEDICKKQNGIFENCIQTIDSKKCDICDDNYF